MISPQEERKLYLIPNVLAPGTINEVLPPSIRDIVVKIKYYLVEDVRTARRFLSELKAGLVIEELHFFIVDKDTSESQILAYWNEIPSNENIGVISEAGCPCIADPGSLVVKLAHEKGLTVQPLAGPSSIFMALMSSGFSGQSFAFQGYLPIEKELRVKAIKGLEKLVLEKKQTQIFMETPFRNNILLEELLKHCQPSTRICIAANITGVDQFIYTKTVKDWQKNTPDLHKIPVIFVMGS